MYVCVLCILFCIQYKKVIFCFTTSSFLSLIKCLVVCLMLDQSWEMSRALCIYFSPARVEWRSYRKNLVFHFQNRASKGHFLFTLSKALPFLLRYILCYFCPFSRFSSFYSLVWGRCALVCDCVCRHRSQKSKKKRTHRYKLRALSISPRSTSKSMYVFHRTVRGGEPEWTCGKIDVERTTFALCL